MSGEISLQRDLPKQSPIQTLPGTDIFFIKAFSKLPPITGRSLRSLTYVRSVEMTDVVMRVERGAFK
jgi:hypothetical protein